MGKRLWVESDFRWWLLLWPNGQRLLQSSCQGRHLPFLLLISHAPFLMVQCSADDQALFPPWCRCFSTERTPSPTSRTKTTRPSSHGSWWTSLDAPPTHLEISCRWSAALLLAAMHVTTACMGLTYIQLSSCTCRSGFKRWRFTWSRSIRCTYWEQEQKASTVPPLMRDCSLTLTLLQAK